MIKTFSEKLYIQKLYYSLIFQTHSKPAGLDCTEELKQVA